MGTAVGKAYVIPAIVVDRYNAVIIIGIALEGYDQRITIGTLYILDATDRERLHRWRFARYKCPIHYHSGKGGAPSAGGRGLRV